MNDKIKKIIKKRRKVYDKEGRSAKWKKMKAESNALCRKRCQAFVNKQKLRLQAQAADASRTFFRNVLAFESKEKTAAIFDVRDLYPGQEDRQVAQALLLIHLNAIISNDFDGIDPGVVPESELYRLLQRVQ